MYTVSFIRYGFWCARFQARYGAYKRQLIVRRHIAMKKYSNALKVRFENGCIRYRENLKKYEASVTYLVAKAVDSYSDCMETRDEKIEEYEELMTSKRDNDRKKLQANLVQV